MMAKKKRHLQPVLEPTVLIDQRSVDARERQWIEADRQLYADFRQLILELMKITANVAAVSQQVLEASERYRRGREP
jgi:hypothetical protein